MGRKKIAGVQKVGKVRREREHEFKQTNDGTVGYEKRSTYERKKRLRKQQRKARGK